MSDRSLLHRRARCASQFWIQRHPSGAPDADPEPDDLIDEVADVLEVARVIVTHAAGELSEDGGARDALGSLLDRTRARAEVASKIAFRHACARWKEADPHRDPYKGRISSVLAFKGVVDPSVLRALRVLEVEGGEAMCSEEWLTFARRLFDLHRDLRVTAARAAERVAEGKPCCGPVAEREAARG